MLVFPKKSEQPPSIPKLVFCREEGSAVAKDITKIRNVEQKKSKKSEKSMELVRK